LVAFGFATRFADGELGVAPALDVGPAEFVGELPAFATTSAVVAAAPALAIFTSADLLGLAEEAGLDLRVELSGVRRLAM
jgi:hypothetical protein